MDGNLKTMDDSPSSIKVDSTSPFPAQVATANDLLSAVLQQIVIGQHSPMTMELVPSVILAPTVHLHATQ
jgi:hypothetical protein